MDAVYFFFFLVLTQLDKTKSHSSVFKQALLDYLQFSPASYSAQWSFTSSTKSSQASSKDKLYISLSCQ